MRITIHLPEALGVQLRRMAHNEHRSLSGLVAEAIQFYLQDRIRRGLGRRVLEVVGKTRIAPEALPVLEEGRRDRA